MIAGHRQVAGQQDDVSRADGFPPGVLDPVGVVPPPRGEPIAALGVAMLTEVATVWLNR